jgi:uncharacterized protein YecE (DUF72 family)
MTNIYIGTSGFNFSHWRKLWYPAHLTQRNWLQVYSHEFPTIEINATFYRPFPLAVYQSWAGKTLDAFRFAIKAPKIITHEKRLRDGENELMDFFSSISGLGEKLGAILWQFPSSFFRNIANEDALYTFLPHLPDRYCHAFEFRHTSWFHPSISDLLQSKHIATVINSSSEFPSALTITSPTVYIRFHGPEELYSSGYTEEHLSRWAEMIRKFDEQVRDVYCFFNNDRKEHAIENAHMLQRLLHVESEKTGLHFPVKDPQLQLKL